MRVLCILHIVLCLACLVLSEFVSLIIKCNTENDEHLEECRPTDQCIWKTSLGDCNSLQLQCTDSKNRKCTSFEECGMANEAEFVNYLEGSISCEFYNKSIECSSSLLCEHKNLVCNEPHCKLKHIVQDDKHCIFSHSFKKCIKENGNFPVKGDLNCTVTQQRKDENLKEQKIEQFLPTPECPPKPGCTEIGYFYAATFGLGSLVVLGLLFALYFLWKKTRNGRGIARERNARSSTINSPPALLPLLGGTGAAMPISQHQDAATDSSLDDPQANAAVPIPKPQDGTLQMDSSQVVKYKVVLEDE